MTSSILTMSGASPVETLGCRSLVQERCLWLQKENVREKGQESLGDLAPLGGQATRDRWS